VAERNCVTFAVCRRRRLFLSAEKGEVQGEGEIVDECRLLLKKCRLCRIYRKKCDIWYNFSHKYHKKFSWNIQRNIT